MLRLIIFLFGKGQTGGSFQGQIQSGAISCARDLGCHVTYHSSFYFIPIVESKFVSHWIFCTREAFLSLFVRADILFGSCVIVGKRVGQIQSTERARPTFVPMGRNGPRHSGRADRSNFLS